MSNSFANGTSVAYNEPTRSSSLFPQYVQENSSAKIVSLIRSYYDYLNSKDNPSYEIQNLIVNHDIDEMSDKYLTAIQLQIAKSVPNSQTLDKRRLFKMIAQYYKTRGSEESIHVFFRIFFNEFITIFYPSSELFHTSDNQSESSSRFKLQDGERWQKYSYEIRTFNNAEQWRQSFLKFVHPAGLRLLIAIIILCFKDNSWEGPVEDFIDNYDEISVNDYWNNIKLEVLLGRHSPKWQPNTSYNLDYLFKVIIEQAHSYKSSTYAIPGVDEDQLYAAVLNVFYDLNLFSYGSSEIFRTQYQSWLKFSDRVKISDGYSDRTIQDASKPYLPLNKCRFESITPTIEIGDKFVDSYVVVEESSGGYWAASNVTEITLPDLAALYTYTTATGTLTYTSATNESNDISILISAVRGGTEGNSIIINLLNPISESGSAVTIHRLDNVVSIIPTTTSLASNIVSALNSNVGHLITTSTPEAQPDEPVKPNGETVASVQLSGGTKTLNADIEMQRKHRPAFIPEAEDIIFS